MHWLILDRTGLYSYLHTYVGSNLLVGAFYFLLWIYVSYDYIFAQIIDKWGVSFNVNIFANALDKYE